MADIRMQKLLYHLTDIQNISSIIKLGILPRNQVHGFSDIADHSIIASRSSLKLETYVPFHFFAKNPFDGRVQRDNPQKSFALLAVPRTLAAQQNWKVIPTHPLSVDHSYTQLLDYDEGINTINWDLMNQRDYRNESCRLTCMAECLSPTAVAPHYISAIYVKDEHSAQHVNQLLNTHGINCHVNVTPTMFIGHAL